MQTTREPEKNYENNEKIICEEEFVYGGRGDGFAVTVLGTGTGLCQGDSCQLRDNPSMTIRFAQNDEDVEKKSTYKYDTKNQALAAGRLLFFEKWQNADFVMDPKICVDGMTNVLNVTPPAGTPGAGITVPIVTATKDATTNKWRYELKVPKTEGDYKVIFWE